MGLRAAVLELDDGSDTRGHDSCCALFSQVQVEWAAFRDPRGHCGGRSCAVAIC